MEPGISFEFWLHILLSNNTSGILAFIDHQPKAKTLYHPADMTPCNQGMSDVPTKDTPALHSVQYLLEIQTRQRPGPVFRI